MASNILWNIAERIFTMSLCFREEEWLCLIGIPPVNDVTNPRQDKKNKNGVTDMNDTARSGVVHILPLSNTQVFTKYLK